MARYWEYRLIDLHTHTTASDGSYQPRDLVRLAAEMGLAAVAITDHDTAAGNAEALQAGPEFGVEVIPGVEISADSTYGSLHILGLFIRPDDEPMEAILRELRIYREERNRRMIDRLTELGIPVAMEELQALAGGEIVGRPHFAALLIKKGIVKTSNEAFDVYLKSGAKAYMEKKRLPTDQAIGMIRAAGGIPILAHPYAVRARDPQQFESRLLALMDQGLRGIEVYYSDHTDQDVHYFADLARRFNLAVSGGTDFHGPAKPGLRLGVGYGDLRIPDIVLENLKETRE
jgi:hypothetical protein